jgi:hypothetical protein
VVRLYGAYLLAAVLLLVVALASITDANAGYPALFLAGVLMATAAPVCVTGAVLAGLSLLRREPYRPAMAAVLVASCVIALKCAGIAVRFIDTLLQTLAR